MFLSVVSRARSRSLAVLIVAGCWSSCLGCGVGCEGMGEEVGVFWAETMLSPITMPAHAPIFATFINRISRTGYGSLCCTARARRRCPGFYGASDTGRTGLDPARVFGVESTGSMVSATPLADGNNHCFVTLKKTGGRDLSAEGADKRGIFWVWDWELEPVDPGETEERGFNPEHTEGGQRGCGSVQRG